MMISTMKPEKVSEILNWQLLSQGTASGVWMFDATLQKQSYDSEITAATLVAPEADSSFN
jgi:hypothetical protein